MSAMLETNSNLYSVKTNFNTFENYINDEMNHYPNVLTPPLDSPDSSGTSISSGNNSPPQIYVPQRLEQSHMYNYELLETTGSPYLVITEQPIDRFRFRYKSEMAGTHGSLIGKNSDKGRRHTFPKVHLHNYDKPATIRCTLYQYSREDLIETRKPHAHRLIKRYGNGEIDDPHHITVDDDYGYTAVFQNMGIIHTARKYVVSELLRKNLFLKREEIAVNEHQYRPLTKKEEMKIKDMSEKESKCINLNIVCLRFDAFKVINGIYYPLCPPVYSNPINNLKSALTGDLKIVRMDRYSSPSYGGQEMFILVEKVTKRNIKVRFFELDDDDIEVWSDYGRFNELDVHHQYAIVLKTPPYKELNIVKEVRVYVELERPTDGAKSEPKDFKYTPTEGTSGRKRARYSSNSYSSSNFSSEELPLTITNMVIEDTEVNSNIHNQVNSAELDDALKRNKIDSAEFEKMFKTFIDTDSFQNFYAAEHLTDKDLKSIGLTMDNGNLKASNRTQVFTSGSYKHLRLEDQKLVERVKSELIAFINSKPNKEKASVMLKDLFKSYTSEIGDNVIHLLITENDPQNQFLKNLLCVLEKYKETALVNITNKKGQSPLHLAVQYNNRQTVEDILRINNTAVCIQDLYGNTPLHIAIMRNSPISILKLLLQVGNNVDKFINILNNDGLTALHLAVKTNNLRAVQLLCVNTADVNIEDKKNGYTAVHMAVADQYIDILKYLIENTDIKCEKEDYGQSNALKLSKVLICDDKPVTKEIYEILEKFMKLNGTFEEINIKEEIDYKSEDEYIDYKIEPASLMVTDSASSITFTTECLNKVCALLNKSGQWESLAELLDYGHLLKTDLFDSVEKPAQSLLNFAIANGDTVIQIRDFLENLDEVEAVRIIDTMIKEHNVNKLST